MLPKSFCFLLAGLLVVIPLWIVLALVWLICGIIATVKAFDGEIYRYPMTFRLIR